MTISSSRRHTFFSIGLASLLVATGTHAEVYKWVDTTGQTHYSERKGSAGGSKPVEVKIRREPEAPAQTTVPSADYLRAQSKFAPPPSSTDMPDKGPVRRVAQAHSDGQDHGTDASRCALARDVLSGAVRHSNGKPTDRYDREVAQNDIKAFCRSR